MQSRTRHRRPTPITSGGSSWMCPMPASLRRRSSTSICPMRETAPSGHRLHPRRRVHGLRQGRRAGHAHAGRAEAGLCGRRRQLPPEREAQFPALVHDAKAAVRWIRANAQRYGFDPQRIAAWGGSAGGYQASMLGVSAGIPELEDLSLGNSDQPSAVQAVVSWFGPTDFLKMDEQLTASGFPPPPDQRHNDADSPESLLLGQNHRDPGTGGSRQPRDLRAAQRAALPAATRNPRPDRTGAAVHPVRRQAEAGDGRRAGDAGTARGCRTWRSQRSRPRRTSSESWTSWIER